MCPSAHAMHAPTDSADQAAPLPDELLHFARRVANAEESVLIYGETGSGKTYLADVIHRLSRRSANSFTRVNCASIPDGLFEREMFGHVRGAFTDAKNGEIGFFEAASGGTLFLDEIGELPVLVQAKLLAALEDGYIRRIGSAKEVPVNVRVIAATNRDLDEMTESRRFRRDLFHRIAVLTCRVPPLRERKSQFEAIVQHLLRRISSDKCALPEVTSDALSLLKTHEWPGNIRQLDNVLRQAIVFANGARIEVSHLPDAIRVPGTGASRRSGNPSRCTAPRYSAPACATEERTMILEALAAEGGNKTRAARRLGMSRSTLWAKLGRNGIAESS